MSTDPSDLKALIEKIGLVAAVFGLPVTIFELINYSADKPFVGLLVALAIAIPASVWVVRSNRMDRSGVITTWLALIVLILAGFMLWPKTIAVEGTILDTARIPVSYEKVLIVDASGVSHEVHTNAEGRYRCESVPRGAYMVRARGREAGGKPPSRIFPVRVMYLDLIVPEQATTSTPKAISVPTDTPIPPTPTPQPVAIIPTDTPTPVPPTDTPTPMPALPTDTPIPAPPADTPTPEPPTPTPTATPALTPEPDAVVNTELLNLRSGPDEAYGVLAVLERGDSLKVTGRNLEGDWLRVIAPNRQEGWVACSLLQVNVDTAGVPVAQAPPTPTPMYTPAPVATPTPTLLPPPILTEPENGATFIGGPVVLKWQWDYRPRAPNEIFSLRVCKDRECKKGEIEPCHHYQPRDLEYWGDLMSYCSEGKHYWGVTLVRQLCTDCPEEEMWQDLSEPSAQRWIYYVPGEEPWTWPTPDDEEKEPGEEPIDL